jgi:hypothetical protein
VEDTADHFFALAAGTRLDEYVIVSIIGQGSFGITYLAEDVNLGMRVAIKEYLPGDWAVRDSTKSVRPKSTNSRQSFEWGMDAFLKEARILAGISHPNIVKVRRFFRANGTAYIVMDFVEGRGFGDILSKEYPSGGYPAAALSALLSSLLGGLGAVHKAGIVHRDIKPANILIKADGNPILIDFGAARNFQRTVAGGMTVIMTPGYAPIEQYGEDDDQGPFTDIYSLGAVAYRAMAGRPPMEPYKRLGGGAFVSAADIGRDRYPAPLLSAIDWAISVHAKDRPQSASDLIARLRGDEDDRTKILDYAPAPNPALPGREFVRRRSGGQYARRNGILLAAICLVIGLGVATVAYYHSGPAPAQDVADAPPSQRVTELASQDAANKAAEAARKEEAVRRAAEAARQEADQIAADAAKREADRQATEAARQEADRKIAEAAKLEAERQAAEVAKQEVDRKAAEQAKQEAARKAQPAKQEAALKAADAARQEADRRAAEGARLEATRRAASRDGRWFADLPRNNCGAVRVQAIVMGDIIFGNLGMPAGNRAFRAVIGADGTFASAGFFDRISGRFAGNTLELTAGNQCSTWVGTARRDAFTLEKASKDEITTAFAGKAAIFANGESIYARDGSYTLTDRNGTNKGNYVVSDGTICVTFVSGIVQCNAILKDGASFTAVSSQGYAYPVAFK